MPLLDQLLPMFGQYQLLTGEEILLLLHHTEHLKIPYTMDLPLFSIFASLCSAFFKGLPTYVFVVA